MVLTLIDKFHPAGNVNISSNKCIVVKIFLSKARFFITVSYYFLYQITFTVVLG